MTRNRATLKAVAGRIAREIRPLVKEIVRIEHDVAGLARQFDAIGVGHTGPEELLEPLQRAADKRYARVTAMQPPHEYLSAADARALLDAIARFFAAFGLDVGAGERLPANQDQPWTADPIIYEEISKDDGSRRAVPRYRLAFDLKLNPDGSLTRGSQKLLASANEEEE